MIREIGKALFANKLTKIIPKKLLLNVLFADNAHSPIFATRLLGKNALTDFTEDHRLKISVLIRVICEKKIWGFSSVG